MNFDNLIGLNCLFANYYILFDNIESNGYYFLPLLWYMNKIPSLFIALLIVCGMISCNSGSVEYNISISNPSDLKRESETIEIHFSQLAGLPTEKPDRICVTDHSGKKLLSQLVDHNSDSIADYLIFQTDFDAHETVQFTLSLNCGKEAAIEDSMKTFCRFVPERIDDFAWENDRVAFRTYGPKCQQMFEEGIKGGLIASGIDCWLKRVEYPIIDKWYHKSSIGGSYHKDTGEGLDNYHVGTTRGCGGTSIIVNDTFVLSENFQQWRIIANGPIRSVFELDYPSHDTEGFRINEKKKITIDLGSNFYRCKVTYEGPSPVEQAAVGIAHHDKEGEITFNMAEGWITYWEPQDDSFLGTAIILDSGTFSSGTTRSRSDADNHWILLKTERNSFSYRAGFGWEKGGRFSSPSQWDEYVKNQTKLEHTPLLYDIIKK
jgi:hypothetical protein